MKNSPNKWRVFHILHFEASPSGTKKQWFLYFPISGPKKVLGQGFPFPGFLKNKAFVAGHLV